MRAEAATIQGSANPDHAQTGNAQPLTLQFDINLVQLPVGSKSGQGQADHFSAGCRIKVDLTLGPLCAAQALTIECDPVPHTRSRQEQRHRIALSDKGLQAKRQFEVVENRLVGQTPAVVPKVRQCLYGRVQSPKVGR